jgi:hypothetical protein
VSHVPIDSLLIYPRWFALVRIWSPWLAPRHGQTHFALDRDAVMCSFMDLAGRHLVLLAISGIDDVLTLFQTDGDGNVIIHVCSVPSALRFLA